ncbi:MAG: hypothetical protein JW746_06575 [Candidatus Krumholzibacteriota bacterium]|nr:hypothetical protein [Candidatus Krumholzibacteriota bacterium]
MKEKTRTIEQKCSVCDDVFDMEVIEEAAGSGVPWLKCPRCKGVLPYMGDEDGEEREEEKNEAEPETGDIAPEDFSVEEKENALEYEKENEYGLGDIIYHRSWNDYGKVISKEVLPGHRKTIIVNFGHQGKIRLLEGES